MINFTPEQASVLNHIQRAVPMVRRPFTVIGNDLGLTEADVMAIITDFKQRRMIRNIAAILNPRSLGYTMGLVGVAVPVGRIDQAAALINAHPGVSHNYLRNHHYNIWFTLAEENEAFFDRSVAFLARSTGAWDTIVLKNEQVYKIGVQLPMGENPKDAAWIQPGLQYIGPPAGEVTWEEKNGIRLLQQDLPVVKRPFLQLAANRHTLLTEERLLELGAVLMDKGIMRRYAAVLRHMKAGFTHNAMTVWKLSSRDAPPSVLKVFINEKAVSHLYRRTIVPGKWGYPLFAMIHAKSEAALTEIVQQLSRRSGLGDYQVLKSLREFKKQRVVYFSDSFLQWHQKAFSPSAGSDIPS